MLAEQRSLKQTSYELISRSDTSGVIKLPNGVTFSGLDLQTGFVSPVGVIRTMLHCRGMLFRLRDDGKDFMSMSQLREHRLIFVVTGEVKVSKVMYNVQVAKYPVLTKSRLASYRKSSFLLETCLTLPGYQTPVASISLNHVCVAKDTRKSAPLPDCWVKKYVEFFEKTDSPNFKLLKSPNETFCQGIKSQPYTFPVRRRDHDSNGHVNTICYLQFSLDALEHHLGINNINCDIHMVSLLLKTAQWLHRGESQLGDTLTVAFWDEETDADTVCFDITKSGQSIYQARMQFYGGSEIITGKSHL